MGQSLYELHVLLENKLPTTGNYSSLQDLKSLLNTLGSAAVRANTLPVDDGSDLSGIVCTGHTPADFPYTGGLSLGQINDRLPTLIQMQCDNQVWSTGYCVSRTAVVCECNSRTLCDCVSRTDYICTARCSCAGRTGVAAVQPECECDGRFIFCLCETRVCSYDCQCNGRTSCNCNTRTDVQCSCNSRTACYCNVRCACNTVDYFYT